MNEMRQVRDLAIGDVIRVSGFDDNMTIRAAKKVKKGLDAGKLHVTLAAPDGETEVVALDPEERVNLANRPAMQPTVKELQAKMEQLRKDLGAPGVK